MTKRFKRNKSKKIVKKLRFIFDKNFAKLSEIYFNILVIVKQLIESLF